MLRKAASSNRGEAADVFMVRWHREEAEKSWRRHAPEDANNSGKGKRGVKGQPY